MATTVELFVASVALAVNSFVLIVMTFLGNLILAPIIGALEKIILGPQVVPMTDMGYIIPAIWAIILIMEIVCIIAFLAVVARRNTVEDYYGGY